MYKLLIVDDDMLARMGMKMLIDWNTYGYQVIDLVDSGEAALEVMKRERPDVVFTDVVMHGMNGVELTRRIKELYPDVLVVALSCYTDVEYVKNIIKMGAEDYLQKLSFGPDDVIMLLKRMSILLDEKNMKTEEKEEIINTELLLKLIHEETENDGELMDRLNINREAEKGVFVIRRKNVRFGSVDTMNKVEKELMSRKDVPFCYARMLEEQTVVLYAWQFHEEFLIKAQEIVKEYPDLCIGFSRKWRGQNFTAHLNEAVEAAKATYLHKDVSVHFFEHEDIYLLGQLYQKFEAIQNMVSEYDFSSMPSALEELTCLMKQLVSHKTMCVQMFSSLSAKLLQLSVMLRGGTQELPIIAHDTADSVEESLNIVLGQLNQLQVHLSNSPERYHPEVKKAMAYIMEHYAEALTLSQIAMHVSLSESYLSSIFKKDCGKGIINYLEEYRINQSLRLLNEHREPLYLVAQHVGYNNVNYFSRVFRKVRNESPSQYLKRQKIVQINPKI